MNENLLICDTTLRDGEQTSGVVFNKKQKFKLAKKFDEFGINIIEIMPAISKNEIEIAELLVEKFNKKIVASTPSNKKYIDLAKSIGISNVTLFTSLSDIHLEKKLKLSREKNLKNSLDNIEYAKSLGLNTSFAGEDSSRADIKYLVDFVNSIGEIDYFLPCDTLGVLTPKKSYNLITQLKKYTNSKVCLHMHNDFGQATANTLAGLDAGADSFSGTFNGIGERAGNASLEEIIVSLKYQYSKNLDIQYEKIGEICKLVEKYSGIFIQKNKPISGDYAFSHESGMHVDGILKYPKNYENFNPEEIGRKRNIIFGKHSGINGLKYFFGNRYNENEYTKILSQIKKKSEKFHKSFTLNEVTRLFAPLK